MLPLAYEHTLRSLRSLRYHNPSTHWDTHTHHSQYTSSTRYVRCAHSATLAHTGYAHTHTHTTPHSPLACSLRRSPWGRSRAPSLTPTSTRHHEHWDTHTHTTPHSHSPLPVCHSSSPRWRWAEGATKGRPRMEHYHSLARSLRSLPHSLTPALSYSLTLARSLRSLTHTHTLLVLTGHWYARSCACTHTQHPSLRSLRSLRSHYTSAHGHARSGAVP